MLICGFEETSYFISFSWRVLSGLIEDFIFLFGDWHTKFPLFFLSSILCIQRSLVLGIDMILCRTVCVLSSLVYIL